MYTFNMMTWRSWCKSLKKSTHSSSRTTSKCSFVFVWGRVYVNHSHTLCPYVTCDSLLIEGTSAASGRAIFAESLCELLVQPVSHTAWDPLPGQDENDYHGVLTAVTSTLPHKTQQLLFLTSSTYDLQNSTRAHSMWRNRHSASFLQTASYFIRVTHPLGDWTTLWAPPLFACIHNNLHTDCVAFLTISVMKTVQWVVWVSSTMTQGLSKVQQFLTSLHKIWRHMYM